jgi:8-oxo-dGTP pyrophosphatase MutT (NUDIX family)
VRIFLNERVIDFLDVVPDTVEPSVKVVRLNRGEDIIRTWHEFYRDEHCVHMIVADSSMVTSSSRIIRISDTGRLHPFSPGFDIFSGEFKYVSAAGGLVTNDRNQWLFIRRLGFWDLPKGKVDRKDFSGGDAFNAIQNAAIREVNEETGVSDVRITNSLPSTWHIYEKKGKLYLKQTYWFKMRTGGDCILTPQLEEDIIEAKWVDFDDLKKYIDQSYRSLREFLLQIIQ